ncbi:MAG: TonB-dependent receptor [Pseudomonadota bacterium]
MVAGKSAPALSGTYSVQGALNAALSGSGLSANPNASGDFIVTLELAAQPPRPVSPTERGEPEERMMADTIIVRGDRLNRTEFDSSASIAVFGEDETDRLAGAQNVIDLLSRVPNIIDIGTSVAVSIRGVDSGGPLFGGDAFTSGSRPRVITAVDGYPLTFNEYVFGATSVYDIKQVEVFRGSQTIAQGTNAIGGALYVFTKDPTPDYEVGGLFEAGNFDRLQAAGYVSGPIAGDQLTARISVDYREQESFLDFSGAPFFDEPTPIGQLGEFNSLVARGKLLWRPNAIPDLEAKFTVVHTDSVAPNGELAVPPFEDLTSPGGGLIESGSTQGIVDISYDLPGGFTATNQFTVADFNFSNFTPTVTGDPALSFAGGDGTQYTNELIIRYDQDGAFSGLLGSYLVQRNSQDTSIFAGEGLVDEDFTSVGLFVQGALKVTDRLEATAALRYQRDSQDRQGFIFGTPVDFDETFDVFLPRFELIYSPSDRIRLGAVVSRGFNGGGVNVPVAGETTVFDQETVWNYEAFARAQFFNGRVTLDANVFFSDYTDFQRTAFTGDFDAEGFPIFLVGGSPVAESYGFEISFDAQVTDKFKLFGSLGLLDTRFEELQVSGNIEEFEFARAPSVTGFFGAEYQPIERLRLSAQTRFVDDYFSTDENLPGTEVDAYVIADISARFQITENVETYFYVENLFDNFYVTNFFFQFGANIGQPRLIGGGVEFKF